MNYSPTVSETTFQPDTTFFEKLVAESEHEVVSEKYVFTITELLSRVTPKNQHLWGCLLPKKGLAAIVGCPDSGKSMFCRELALSIALGKAEFAGYPLDANNRRVIYVSTEDGEDASQASFLRQTGKHSTEHLENPENLRVIFTDQIDLDTLLKRLSSLLIEKPVDLIILDSYGDLFDGKDMNSNSDVRKFLKIFNGIASEFGCLILFIHHINKSGYNDSPSQRHVQGAGALVQKLRTVFDLRLHDSSDSKRYFTILKGNSIPRELKKRAIEYEFDEDTLTFSITGNEKPLSDFLPIRPQREQHEDIDFTVVFEPNEPCLNHKTLNGRIQERFGVSKATANRKIKDHFQKDEKGLYNNPRYQGIMVSAPLGSGDTMIVDTNEYQKL